MTVQQSTATVAPREIYWGRWIAITALLFGLFSLAMNFARFVAWSAKAIRYPFELDYGEGIVWQQALRMLQATLTEASPIIQPSSSTIRLYFTSSAWPRRQSSGSISWPPAAR